MPESAYCCSAPFNRSHYTVLFSVADGFICWLVKPHAEL